MLNIEAKFKIVKGSMQDYNALAEYHYIGKKLGPAVTIEKIIARKRYYKNFPDPIAVNVIKMPIPDLKSRTKATDGYFKRPSTKSQQLKLVNRNIRYGARLIVDPRFRKLGLATMLVKHMLDTATIPIIEVLTPIDFTNDMLINMGFKIHYSPAPTWYRRFTRALETIGLPADYSLLPSTLERRLACLDKTESKFMKTEITNFLHQFRRRENYPTGSELTKIIMSKIPYPQAYLIWYNPRQPLKE